MKSLYTSLLSLWFVDTSVFNGCLLSDCTHWFQSWSYHAYTSFYFSITWITIGNHLPPNARLPPSFLLLFETIAASCKNQPNNFTKMQARYCEILPFLLPTPHSFCMSNFHSVVLSHRWCSSDMEESGDYFSICHKAICGNECSVFVGG